jgi:hypothetical protein
MDGQEHERGQPIQRRRIGKRPTREKKRKKKNQRMSTMVEDQVNLKMHNGEKLKETGKGTSTKRKHRR